MSIDTLIDQLEEALESRFYFLSLATALTVPDIAGAIDSADGRASGEKYKIWYDKWVLPRFSINVSEMLKARGSSAEVTVNNPFSGSECYYYRCAMLHQARSLHDRSAFSRVMFIEPGATTNTFHYNIVNGALAIDLPSFCLEVTQGYRDWVATTQENENYKRNISNTMQRHSDGLEPYIGGVPVIS